MYREPTNETVVNIHKDNPYTHLERRLSGSWTSMPEEDVINEVLRIIALEINPSEAIKRLEKKNVDLEDGLARIEETNKKIDEAVESAYSAIEELNKKSEQINNVVNEVSRQFMLSSELTGQQRAEIAKQYRGVGVGDEVNPNEVVNIKGKLFKMVQPSPITIDAENWLDDPSLFTPFLQKTITDEETGEEIEVVEEFRKPQGSHDAYAIGNKVLFEGQVYESIIDENVWTPTEHPQGWRLVVEAGDEIEDEEPQEEEVEEAEEDSEEAEDTEEPTEPEQPQEEEASEEEIVEDFVTPTGGHDAYSIGDKVRFNGNIYQSAIDGNVWSPSDHPQGWSLIE